MFHPRKIAARFCLPILAMLGAALSRPLAATTCETLTSLSLTNTTITEATSVAAGAFGSDLPPFCRVVARSAPTADSNIKFEVWMPIAGWNGKFLGVGNNGFGGEISYPLMKEPLARGYATASTDTGHEGSSVDASFAFGHPEKLIDFGYRAVHEMAVDAKAIIAFYYARAATFSYWNGCSTGGRQGLMEAQRFPGDFDGIIAGAPANNMTHFAADGVWISQAVQRNPASYVPPTLHPIIHQAVLDACDARDGVKDGVLEDPRACAFDPKILECTKGVETSGCLTTRQVETLRKIYGAASNPRTKQVIFPGLAPGSELGWTQFWVGPDPLALAASLFKYVVFKDPGWDYRSLNFDSDIARADRIDNGTSQCRRSQSERIFHPRREASAVPRLERSWNRTAQQHQLLHERTECDGRAR